MEGPVIEFNIKKRYLDFDLQVEARFKSGITAVFGPSGSGKTTLLNCIAGLVHPEEGTIRLQGLPLFSSTEGVNLPSEKRRVGYLFQDGALFPHLSVQQNIMYGHNLTPTQRRKVDPEHLIQLLNLGHLVERRVVGLSGGEAQRVALARALATSPELLLLDEPLASLDVALRGIILRYLRKVWHEFNIPMVFVSHSISEVMAIASKTLVLSKGRRVDYGLTRQLLAHPNVYSVDEYFGLENILEAEVIGTQSTEGLTQVKIGDAKMVVTGAIQQSRDNGTASISIRAGDIILSPDRPSRLSARNILRGRISEIHSVGETVLVYADVGVDLVATITPAALIDLSLTEGQEVYLVIKANSVMVLDAEE